ncbi:MAG: hypothetical protein MR639_06015 [Clostridium sp.]|uniref:hypothetical protein n=1 Tax=Clostridium sp. TaxID=1506 RepID=UPI002A87DD1F|nr:hypothetical protein [Clostridium sp.]MDY5099255.1 hypothetical protein [Clostridium sp.]
MYCNCNGNYNENDNVYLREGFEGEVILTDPPGTKLQLENCKCPDDVGPVSFDAKTQCRAIRVQVRISNLCPNKEFLLFITVYDDQMNKIGQICDVFTTSSSHVCTSPYNQYVTLLIKKPVCSTDYIWVDVRGNYTSICDF